MVKNKSKLAIKLFIIVWCVLAVHIALKLTFNYWQPYIISNDKLQAISDFIDSNEWLKILLNGVLYFTNALKKATSGCFVPNASSSARMDARKMVRAVMPTLRKPIAGAILRNGQTVARMNISLHAMPISIMSMCSTAAIKIPARCTIFVHRSTRCFHVSPSVLKTRKTASASAARMITGMIHSGSPAASAMTTIADTSFMKRTSLARILAIPKS